MAILVFMDSMSCGMLLMVAERNVLYKSRDPTVISPGNTLTSREIQGFSTNDVEHRYVSGYTCFYVIWGIDSSLNSALSLLNTLFIYSRETQREAETQAEGEAGFFWEA